MERPAGAPDRVLVLCTANQCRSPLAGSILRRDVQRRGLRVEVLTAGLGDPGLPATPPPVEAAEQIGLDLRDHQSRTVDANQLAVPDRGGARTGGALTVRLLHHVLDETALDRPAQTEPAFVRPLIRPLVQPCHLKPSPQ